MGHQTLLPVGVPGKAVEQTLRAALGGSPTSSSFTGGLSLLGAAILGDLPEQQDAAAMWEAAGVAGGPLINGNPIPKRYVDNDMVRPRVHRWEPVPPGDRQRGQQAGC